MLIVSNFHDYYDGVSSLGVDKTCVYNRISKQEPTPKEHCLTYRDKKDLPTDNIWRLGRVPYHRPIIIGFCGKYYLGYEFERISGGEKQLYFEYDYEKIHKELKSINGKNWYYEDYFENAVLFYKTQSSLPLHRQFHCPVFVLDYNSSENRYKTINNNPNLILNPCLKNYNFQPVKDAYTTHQEIYQFMSGVLGNQEKEIIEISEKDKLVQHGMDKWSFKNPEPPKRKQK